MLKIKPNARGRLRAGRGRSEPLDGALPVTGVVAAGVLASLLNAGCYHHVNRRVPVTATAQPVVLSDIRGVAFTEEAGGGEVRFFEVLDVRWLPEALEMDGRVDAGTVDTSGSLERRLSPTTSVPLEDVDYVIVRDYHPGGSHLGSFLGAAVGSAAGMFLATLALLAVGS